TEPVPAATASSTVRVATGTEEAAKDSESSETQTPTPAADLASTVSYLKSLNDTLKTATDALNGDNPTEKTEYYKAVEGRTLYWDGFIHKIVLTDFDKTSGQNTANEDKIKAWFGDSAN
ncbi:hemagglutinin, partial [Mycoplasmopsis synoviae]